MPAISADQRLDVRDREPSKNGGPTAPDDTPRPPTAKPTNSEPVHGATGVALNATLKWSAAAGATSYQVYFGTDSTPDGGELIGDQAETTFDPELEYDTIYFWRIDSKNEVGTITGDVWKFRTRATPVPKPAKATSPRPAHETTGCKPPPDPRMERGTPRDELRRVPRHRLDAWP